MKSIKKMAVLFSFISVFAVGIFSANASELNVEDAEPMTSTGWMTLPEYYASYYGGVDFSETVAAPMDMTTAAGMALVEYYASYYGGVNFDEVAEGTALIEYYASYYGGVDFSQTAVVPMDRMTAQGTALVDYYASYYGGNFDKMAASSVDMTVAQGTALIEYYASYFGGVNFNQSQIAQGESGQSID